VSSSFLTIVDTADQKAGREIRFRPHGLPEVVSKD